MTERTRETDTICDIIVVPVDCRQICRRDAVLDPLHHCGKDVVFGIERERGHTAGGLLHRTECVGSVATLYTGQTPCLSHQFTCFVGTSLTSLSNSHQHRSRTTAKSIDAPVVHAGHREQAVEIVDVHVGIRVRPCVNALVIVQRVAGADELVRPSDVL